MRKQSIPGSFSPPMRPGYCGFQKESCKIVFEHIVRDCTCASKLYIRVSVSCVLFVVLSRMAIHPSYEPMRTSAYSEDIRWRMVWQREVQGFTLKRVARNLSVDVSTVHRIVKKFEETGNVSKRKYSVENRHQLQKLTKAV